MYLDPNTGGMLFQLLAVIFAALSGLVLFFQGKIRMFLSRLKRRVRESSGEHIEDSSGPEADSD